MKKLNYVQESCHGKVLGHHPEVKLAAVLRMLTQGLPPRSICIDYQMGETTLRYYLESFVDDFLALFYKKYLEPDLDDVVRENAKVHGVPGLLGSLDCTHFAWAMCPKAHQASFQGRSGSPSVTLECIADAHRRVIHFYYGVPGAQNDINVLKSSPLMDKFLNGEYPSLTYCLGGETFQKPFILTDGIYQKYSCFVGTITEPSTPALERLKVLARVDKKRR